MIDYGPFEFAAPPLAGGAWFYRAMKTVLGETMPRGRVLSPWKSCLPADRSDKVRLSLVIHPEVWIGRYVLFGIPFLDCCFDVFAGMKTERFFHAYSTSQVRLADVYNTYEADVIQRVEDQPAALEEFLGGFGITGTVPVCTLEPPAKLPSWIKEVVRKKEREIYERFDYW